MALERIERIDLDNYRAFDGEMSFRFVGPLTIIHGLNASGKSSVIRSIIDALTTDEGGQQCVEMNRRNNAGACSMVDLQFYSAGELFRIKKRFIPNHTATSEFFPWGNTRVNQPIFFGINATRCTLALSLPLTHFAKYRRGPNQHRGAICSTLLGDFISPAAIQEMQQLLSGWLVRIFPFEVGSRPVLDRTGRLTHLIRGDDANENVNRLSSGLIEGLRHLHRMAEAIVAANRCGFSRVVLFDDPIPNTNVLDEATGDRFMLLMSEVGDRENMQFIVTSNRCNPVGAATFIHLR